MTTVTTEKQATLEDAENVITELCKLVEACYAVIDQVDTELFHDNYEEAAEIIEQFYAITEQEQRKLH